METAESVENAHFMGQRVGDMDRAGMLSVIAGLANQLASSNAAHSQTLKTWSAATKARAA
jgi:hypothetical protein